ncbi:MAG: glycosyltransferase N-terminal domain-containing protein [Pseudomonadota bacterium]
MTQQPKAPQTTARLRGQALARYVRLVAKTSRLIASPPDAQVTFRERRPQIVALWHGQFMMVPSVAGEDAVRTEIMIARHGDAEIISEAMSAFGMGLIRGAGAGERRKNRGGVAALRQAVRALDAGNNVAMTADVPPGPARKAGLGIVTLARISGCSILPVAVATNRFLTVDTWSRMTINLPFSKQALVVGDPIHVANDATPEDMERARKMVEDALNAATAQAYRLCGGNLERATPPSALPPGTAPLPIGPRLIGYRGLTRALSPAASLFLKRRERRGKEDPERRSERLGRTEIARPSGPLVWFHAASVGETNAIMPVIDAIYAERPNHNFLLTTGTVTSATLVAKRATPNVIHQFVPIDTPGAVQAFLRHWNPNLAVFTESEIWPNMLIESATANIPLVLVNARMSKKSYTRWWRRRGTARQLFGRFKLILAQNEGLARRFRSLGARDVRPMGNIKVDAPGLPVNQAAFDRFKASLGGRRIFLAASTHPGEDEVILDALAILAPSVPNLLTVIVPRHPHRGDDIEKLATARQHTTARRSRDDQPGEKINVYIADTIGELALFYRAADAAFIGGSLVRHGGQNPIEPIREGAAVVAGPHTFNFEDAYQELERAGGVTRVENASDLASAMERLLTQPIELERSRQASLAGLGKLSGGLRKTIDALLDVLPDDEDLRRAS